MHCSTSSIHAAGLLLAVALSGCAVEDHAPPEVGTPDGVAADTEARAFAVVAPAEGFRALVQDDGALSLAASSRRDAGTVRIRYRWLTTHDHGDGVVEAGWLDARASATIDLPIRALALPRRPLAFSGHLIAVPEIEYDSGEVAEARAFELHFHPHGSGWEMYDTAARDRDFDGGALSPEMKRVRRDIVSAGRGRTAPVFTANVMVEFTPLAEVDDAVAPSRGAAR